MIVYILRPRLAFFMMFRTLLAAVAALSGAAVCRAARLLFTAPRSMVAMDLLAIPGVLLIGWLFFMLGRQLFKSPMDEDGSGPFSAVGVKAWFLFLVVLAGLVGGVCIGANPKFDWQSHPKSYWEAINNPDPLLPQGSPLPPGKPQSPGKIYMGPSVPDSSKPATPSHS